MDFGTIRRSPAKAKPSILRVNLKRNSRASKARLGILSLAVLAIVLVACGSSTSSSDSSSSGGGEPAFNFSVTLFQGQDALGTSEVEIHQLNQGKPVVLNFWAGLCPPCRAEMPDLQEFSDEFGDRLTLLGVDLGQFTGLGSREDAKNLLEELGVTYPTGFTEDAGVIQNYRVLGLPATIFIDAEGKIFKNWGGALNLDVLREQSNAMLNQ